MDTVRLPLLLLLVPWLCAAATAQDSSTLVRQLGDPEPERREDAFRLLAKRGDAAVAALVEGVASADPEVARSCARLLIRHVPAAAPHLRAAAIRSPRFSESVLFAVIRFRSA